MTFEKFSKSSRDQDGFTLMVVLLALVVMTTLAIAGLVTAGDEHRASSAMRESSAAFYVAEAGLNEVFANWSSHQAAIDSLASGDSLDLGWQTMSTGDSYRAVVHRWDMGERPLYELVVQGRSEGLRGGTRTLSYALTTEPSEMGTGYKLGECCDAPVLVRGDVDVKDNSVLSGYDEHPAGWADAGVCSDSLYDKPGLVIQDMDSVNISSGGTVTGDPALVEDPAIEDSTFSDFGDLTWEEIKDMAEVAIGEPGKGESYDTGDVYPRYTVDMTTGETICDTSHPLNWGSPDPNDPCFNHFPVVLVRGDVDLQYGVYAQGIFITDFWTDTTGTSYGSELDIEDDVVFNGIVLGKGCVEIQRLANVHGAVFGDSHWTNSLCGGDDTVDMNDEGYMTWSQCAVDRALYNSIFKPYAVPTEEPPGGGARRLGERSFGEMF